MEKAVKINRFALISFLCGLMAIVSMGIGLIVYAVIKPSDGIILFVTDGVLIPVRNLSVISAFITGILALRDIQQKQNSEKGKWLAWAGVGISSGMVLIGVFVGLAFLLSRFIN